MRRRLLAAVALLCWTGIARADVAGEGLNPSWSTSDNGPKTIRVVVDLPFVIVGLPPWLSADPMGGVGPATITLRPNRQLAPKGGATAWPSLNVTREDLSLRANPITAKLGCSTLNPCGPAAPPPPSVCSSSLCLNPGLVEQQCFCRPCGGQRVCRDTLALCEAGCPPLPSATTTIVRPTPTPSAAPSLAPTVRPTSPPPTSTIRRAPAGRSAYWQVSLELNKITPVRWCYQMDPNGVPLAPFTPTQVCMNQMVRTRMIGVNDALRAARDIPACDGARKKVTSRTFDSEMNTTLDPVYRRRFDSGRGIYVVDTKGPDYKKAQDAAEQFQRCFTSDDGAELCARHPAIARVWDRFGPRPPDLFADFLTIHVEDGRCVVGAEVHLPAPDESTYDKARLTLGHIELGGLQPTLSPEILAKLDECEHLHHLASLDKPLPAGKSVKTCHIELEDLARNDRELGFLSILPFSGAVDPTITVAELKLIKAYEHRWYGCWAGALRRGDWEESDQCSVAHFAAHDLRNYKDARMLFRFPCRPTPGAIRDCPIETWTEVLARLAREAGTTSSTVEAVRVIPWTFGVARSAAISVPGTEVAPVALGVTLPPWRCGEQIKIYATALAPEARRVRIDLIAPDGQRAWSRSSVSLRNGTATVTHRLPVRCQRGTYTVGAIIPNERWIPFRGQKAELDVVVP